MSDPDRPCASFTVPLGWSSDGTELLYLREGVSDQTFPRDRHLYILHADGTVTQVTPEPVGGAAISPDGSLVVYASAASDGLYVVDAEGGQPIRIAEGEEPTFSPNGTQIAYLGLPHSGCCVPARREHVWVANADGSGAHEILTDEPALAKGVFELTWSPAGDRIAMENSLEGHVAIFTFAPDGSDFTKVITGGINAFWSPDGSQIAYSSGGPIVIADADGSNGRSLGVGTSGPWHPGAPQDGAGG
jgi:Tol biopolymer transport system component